ncbi:hypothetical protein H5410_018119 [Solanum commersonii]|uniref:Uncharacterized protein n=1 Tax=Solanum commersonii TaxID=4109 RepID=A0A9J6A2E8_SOLCO|nr:hypothetical protein H5410_018119 [Solanum commersonii]
MIFYKCVDLSLFNFIIITYEMVLANRVWLYCSILLLSCCLKTSCMIQFVKTPSIKNFLAINREKI